MDQARGTVDGWPIIIGAVHHSLESAAVPGDASSPQPALVALALALALASLTPTYPLMVSNLPHQHVPGKEGKHER